MIAYFFSALLAALILLFPILLAAGLCRVSATAERRAQAHEARMHERLP